MIVQGDCLKLPLPDRSVDLVFGSPPYEDARSYGIGFSLRGEGWVEWAVPRFMECLRVSTGLTAWVVGGRTRLHKWSATPALLVAELHRLGVCLRNPPIYYRSGIPGSGGKDWLRSNYEWIVCATAEQKRLPWSDPCATGKPPVYGPGGDCTNRQQNGQRMSKKRSEDKRLGGVETQTYKPPKIANPGNVIRCSGGHLGHPLAHENEAPFPEKLAEFFVRSFCPPGGLCLDPFGGSGTTANVCRRFDRRAVSLDIRMSQCELTRRRLAA